MRRVSKSALVVFSATGLLIATAFQANAQSGSRYNAPSGSGGKTPPAEGSARRQQPPSGSGQRTQAQAPLALEGYCPVSLKTMNKWVQGDPSIQAAFDGHTYDFANEEGRRMFEADPVKYAPVLGGDCVVSVVKMGKRVPGNIRHAARHAGRLFLFANDWAKKMFLADPQAYANADLALGGNCAVCRVEMGQTGPGKAEFTVVHGGLRYLFPSAEMRDQFLASPRKYAVAAGPVPSAPPGSGSREPAGSGSGSR